MAAIYILGGATAASFIGKAFGGLIYAEEKGDGVCQLILGMLLICGIVAVLLEVIEVK